MSSAIDCYYPLIENSYSKIHVKKFADTYLNNFQYEQLKKYSTDIMSIYPCQPLACAYLSAMMVEFARQDGISAYLAAGSLTFKDNILFNYDPIVESNDYVERWNGHCWVIFNDCIADLSIFRTAYADTSPVWLSNLFINNFGKKKGALIATPLATSEIGFNYKPMYIFNDNKISGLLNNTESTISKLYNIPIDPHTSRVVCKSPGM